MLTGKDKLPCCFNSSIILIRQILVSKQDNMEGKDTHVGQRKQG